MSETIPPTAPEGAAPPRKAPRWRKVLLFGGGGLVLLLGILAALLPTILSSGFVREKVQAAASEAAGRSVSLGSLDVGWSAVAVKDLVVRWGPAESDPVLARVAEIRVPAGITLAFASRYDAGEIEILRPEIRVDLREAAKKPREKPPAEPSPDGGKRDESPIPPFSAKVKVREGVLVLIDLEGKERRLGGFSADLTASRDGPAEVSFALDAGPGGKATFHAKATPFREGKVAPPEALEAAFEAALDSFDPGIDGIEGVVTGSLSARASGDGAVQDGKILLDVRGLSMKGVEEPEIHAEGGFTRGADGTVEVRGGLLRMKGLEASATASLLPTGAVIGTVHATAALDQAAGRAKRYGVPFEGFLVGDAVLDVRGASDGKTDRFTGSLSISGCQVGFGLKTTPIDEPSARAEFDLVREGAKWTVAALSVKASTADASVTGTAMQDLSAADLAARVRVRLGPAVKIARAFGAPIPGEVSGNLDLEAVLRRSGKDGDEARGSLAITDLSVLPPGEGAKPVKEARLTAEFEAVPGKEFLDLRRFAWKGAGAEVRAAGRARMDGSSGEMTTLEADVDLARAAALAAAFGTALPAGVAGTAEWRGLASWKDAFATAGVSGSLLLRDLVLTLPAEGASPERVLREGAVRVGVDVSAKKAGTGYDLAVRESRFTGMGIDLAAAGTAAADGALDLSVKGTASIPEALRRAADMKFLGKDPAARGTVVFDVGVKGKPGDLRAEVRALDARDAEFDLHASGAFAEQGAGDLSLDAGGDLAALLDLAARAGLLEPVKGAAGKVRLRGTAKAAGPGAPLHLELTAGVEGLAYPDPSGGAPWTQKGIAAEIAADLDRKTLSVTGTAKLASDDGTITATGTADRDRVDARAQIDFDAGGFCRSRPDLLPLPDATVGRAKGALWVKGPVASPLDVAKLDGGARLSLDVVKTEPVELKDAVVDLFLSKGVLEARTISATVNGGKVSGSAGVGLSGEEPKHFLDVRGEGIRIDSAMNFLVRRAVPLFVVGDGGGVEGTLKFDVRLDAAGKEWLPVKKTMVGKGSLAVNDGAVTQSGILGDILELLDGGKGISFRSLSTEFSVHDRRIWNDRLLVDGSEHAMVIKGNTAFNGDLDYVIGVKGLRLPKKTLERIRPLLDAEGNLPFTLRGNFEKPKIKGPDLKKSLKGLLGGKDD